MTQANLETVLRQAVENLQLLTARGELVPLDSLSIVLLATELERLLSVRIPPRLYRHEHFSSFAHIQSMLAEQLQLGARPR
jgi:acyl carrier protein